MSRKKPSAADYLDNLERGEAPAKAKRSATSEEPAVERKRKITLYFHPALLEEARSAVLALGAEGQEPNTLSALFNAALERELVRLRRLHNDGEPFPRYQARLPGGRPRG